MNTSINLVLPKDKEFVERQRKGRILNSFAIVLPIMIGVISVSIFLITQAIDPIAIRKQQEETIREITRLQDRRIKLFIVKDRLDNIDDLLKKRINFAENINIFLSKIPSEVFVENFEIDKKEVILTVSSLSLKSIDDFINNLVDMAEKEDTIRTLSLDFLIFDEKNNNYLVALKSEL